MPKPTLKGVYLGSVLIEYKDTLYKARIDSDTLNLVKIVAENKTLRVYDYAVFSSIKSDCNKVKNFIAVFKKAMTQQDMKKQEIIILTAKDFN